MSLRLLLVRHGLSSFNLEQRIQGRDDLSDLSEEGHRQARAAGEALRGLPIDQVYASPDLAFISRRLGQPTGSDHRPVVTEITRAAR